MKAKKNTQVNLFDATTNVNPEGGFIMCLTAFITVMNYYMLKTNKVKGVDPETIESIKRNLHIHWVQVSGAKAAAEYAQANGYHGTLVKAADLKDGNKSVYLFPECTIYPTTNTKEVKVKNRIHCGICRSAGVEDPTHADVAEMREIHGVEAPAKPAYHKSTNPAEEAARKAKHAAYVESGYVTKWFKTEEEADEFIQTLIANKLCQFRRDGRSTAKKVERKDINRWYVSYLPTVKAPTDEDLPKLGGEAS